MILNVSWKIVKYSTMMEIKNLTTTTQYSKPKEIEEQQRTVFSHVNINLRKSFLIHFLDSVIYFLETQNQ